MKNLKSENNWNVVGCGKVFSFFALPEKDTPTYGEIVRIDRTAYEVLTIEWAQKSTGRGDNLCLTVKRIPEAKEKAVKNLRGIRVTWDKDKLLYNYEKLGAAAVPFQFPGRQACATHGCIVFKNERERIPERTKLIDAMLADINKKLEVLGFMRKSLTELYCGEPQPAEEGKRPV